MARIPYNCFAPLTFHEYLVEVWLERSHRHVLAVLGFVHVVEVRAAVQDVSSAVVDPDGQRHLGAARPPQEAAHVRAALSLQARHGRASTPHRLVLLLFNIP